MEGVRKVRFPLPGCRPDGLDPRDNHRGISLSHFALDLCTLTHYCIIARLGPAFLSDLVVHRL